MRRLATIVALLAAGITTGALPARAQHDAFHHKWPYRWDTSAIITTLPFTGVHGCQLGGECVAAYDLVIANNVVVAGSEGTAFAQGGFLPGECSSNGSYGNFVDVDGVRYAHFDSFAPSVMTGASVVQGDQLGTQGSTGRVEPCPGGVHLHWEFRGAPAAPTINGNSNTSTNSVVGEFSASGATERQYYQSHGSWNSIGWTHNLGGGLNMFANRSWGRIQDFRHHPDGFGGEFNTIHVANWNTGQAFLVDSVFWAAWAAGGPDKVGTVRPISMASQERGACPAGSSTACISYQRFHLGYVWMNNFTGRAAVFCPDVRPPTDNAVNTNDTIWVLSLVGTREPQADIDGNGAVNISDPIIVNGNVGGFNVCYPR